MGFWPRIGRVGGTRPQRGGAQQQCGGQQEERTVFRMVESPEKVGGILPRRRLFAGRVEVLEAARLEGVARRPVPSPLAGEGRVRGRNCAWISVFQTTPHPQPLSRKGRGEKNASLPGSRKFIELVSYAIRFQRGSATTCSRHTPCAGTPLWHGLLTVPRHRPPLWHGLLTVPRLDRRSPLPAPRSRNRRIHQRIGPTGVVWLRPPTRRPSVAGVARSGDRATTEQCAGYVVIFRGRTSIHTAQVAKRASRTIFGQCGRA